MEKIIWTDRVRNEEILRRVREGEEYPAYSKKEGTLTGLVRPCVGTGL